MKRLLLVILVMLALNFANAQEEYGTYTVSVEIRNFIVNRILRKRHRYIFVVTYEADVESYGLILTQ